MFQDIRDDPVGSDILSYRLEASADTMGEDVVDDRLYILGGDVVPSVHDSDDFGGFYECDGGTRRGSEFYQVFTSGISELPWFAGREDYVGDILIDIVIDMDLGSDGVLYGDDIFT